MFTLEETQLWSAEETFRRLEAVKPVGWVLTQGFENGWFVAALVDAEGVQQWSGEHVDPKILGLDALGWLRLRGHQVKNPVWRPRADEVPLHREPMPVISQVPDPADLDPSEVATVYRTSR